jgi:phospholipase C
MNIAMFVEALPLAAGAKLVLATASPLQSFLDKPGITHEFCNRQAIAILRNEGFERAAVLLDQHLSQLNAGVLWADKGWKNVNHYYQPVTKKGLWRFASAWDEFEQYYGQMLAYIRRRNLEKACFYLGAASHLLQDMCVPHHVCCKVLDGHKQYETWAQERRFRYAIEGSGCYIKDNSVQALFHANATIAADLFDWVKAGSSEEQYHQATEITLPLAQRSTAGLFQHAASLVSQISPQLFAQPLIISA